MPNHLAAVNDLILDDTDDESFRRRKAAIEGSILNKSPRNGKTVISFESVAGLVEAKQALREAVMFPVLYQHLFVGILSKHFLLNLLVV